jgi:hypothetical protein
MFKVLVTGTQLEKLANTQKILEVFLEVSPWVDFHKYG